MKKLYYLMSVQILLAGHLNAQTRIVEVQPLLGSLNNVIDGDTTAAGERIDPNNTVYQLQGGQLYPLIRTIENNGYPLHIRTNPDDPARAVLQPFAVGGGESARAFEARGDLRIEGLRVKNVDQLGGVQERIIRARQDNIRITIDNCWLEVDAQTAIRMDQGGTRIFISNSIVSNIGLWNDPDNGRLIDDRGNDLDSLEIYNTLVYNITSRILRNGGGVTNWARIDQNTFVNTGQRGMEFGFAKDVFVTNNMIVNVGLRGKGEGGSQAFVEIQEWIGQGSQTLVVSHNNLFFEQAVLNLYPAGHEYINLLDELAIGIINDPAMVATNTEEVLTFNNPAPTPLAWVTDFFNDNVPNSQPSFDPDLLTWDFYYAESFDSYTGGTNGQPIGILPADFGSFVRNARSEVEFTLYPNPMKDQFFIDIPEEAGVGSIKVYNLLGAEVASQGINRSGVHSISMAGLPSGMYLITVIDRQGKPSTKKLVKQ